MELKKKKKNNWHLAINCCKINKNCFFGQILIKIVSEGNKKINNRQDFAIIINKSDYIFQQMHYFESLDLEKISDIQLFYKNKFL